MSKEPFGRIDRGSPAQGKAARLHAGSRRRSLAGTPRAGTWVAVLDASDPESARRLHGRRESRPRNSRPPYNIAVGGDRNRTALQDTVRGLYGFSSSWLEGAVSALATTPTSTSSWAPTRSGASIPFRSSSSSFGSSWNSGPELHHPPEPAGLRHPEELDGRSGRNSSIT
jgi:hypothetical protein